jgi:DNA primase
MISQNSIDQLKNNLDIIDTVSNYIELKKTGANYKAPCPFHDEKSPSFVVSPSKQIYHCFGCGAGGDSIKFVMEYEKLNYPESIEKLADLNNFTLTYSENRTQKQSNKPLEQIQHWYKRNLEFQGNAKQYLENRGIFHASIEKFGIGYAPSNQNTLHFLRQNFISLNDTNDLGITGEDNGNYFSRFIDRIQFPIYSANGGIIGFGGRTIGNHPAKYINSPQTTLFNKSRILYAYNVAKEHIYKKKRIIITEGYLDVIMLHQAGFNTAVATLGTALTSDHLPLLRRGSPYILMAYDGDNAGKQAALKASKLLSASGVDAGVVIFDGGLDPADMVKNNQINELENLFRHPKPVVNYTLEEIIKNFNLHNPKEKENALHEALKYLRTLSPLLQEEYKPLLSVLLNINSGLIKITKSKNTPIHKISFSTKNYGELSLIKSFLEHPQLIQDYSSYLKGSMFIYQELYLDVVHRNINKPTVQALMIDEDIIAFSLDNFKQEILTFLIYDTNKKIKMIQGSEKMSFEEKTFKIRKYRNKLLNLKRGIW